MLDKTDYSNGCLGFCLRELFNAKTILVEHGITLPLLAGKGGSYLS